ncbi:BppU family phage baseplate upper protein [Bacillus cytotoxicus]|uniref:BppU family phage baseplate upper protein n=1 Tax=Bacillus cytotoxicus TaxID=580165 RepID=A0ACC6A3X4_9BACI|nr:BppU family phage baseplate upper protein [Bacillus cytotoxicus]
MKIKLILDINKNEFSQLNYIVTGRIGDKASNTVDVYIIDGGAPYPLTGLSVFYECLKPDNKFVRDSNGIKIIDAAKGHFEYTFPAQVFTAHGKTKRSFFSIEKDTTIRATTQDFVLVTLQDASTGNIQSDQYISDMEKLITQANGIIKRIKDLETQAQGIIDKEITDLRNKANSLLKEIQNNADKIIAGIQTNSAAIKKQLDDLQNKINTFDVVKKSGDTMTGNLTLQKDLYQLASQNHIFAGDSDRKSVRLFIDGDSLSVVPSKTNGGADWDYAKAMRLGGDSTNLLKKTGDTMTGHIQLDRVNSTDVRYVQYKLGSAFEYSAGVNKQGKYHLYDHANSATVFEYDPLTKAFTMLSNANLLKKSGDMMTGPLKVKIDASNASPIVAETLDGAIRLLPWSTANYIQSGTPDGEAKDLIISGNSAKKINKVQVIAKEFIVEGVIKQSNDIDWMNLTLINGATVDGGRTPKYKCHNNVVYIVGAVANIKDGMTIANMPSGLRPPSDCTFVVTYFGDGDRKYFGELNARADGRITIDWMWSNPKTISFCISYHL